MRIPFVLVSAGLVLCSMIFSAVISLNGLFVLRTVISAHCTVLRTTSVSVRRLLAPLSLPCALL